MWVCPGRQALIIKLCVCVCSCTYVFVRTERRPYKGRTFWESEDILTAPHFINDTSCDFRCRIL